MKESHKGRDVHLGVERSEGFDAPGLELVLRLGFALFKDMRHFIFLLHFVTFTRLRLFDCITLLLLLMLMLLLFRRAYFLPEAATTVLQNKINQNLNNFLHNTK